MDPIQVVLALAFVVFAGFLAGTEAALTSISRYRVDEMVEAKQRGAATVKRVLADAPRYLNVILFVRKACELTATLLVALIFLNHIVSQTVALAYTVGLMLVVLYVLVGVGPRTLGKQRPEGWVRPGASVAVALAFILGPVTRILISIGNAITPGKGFREGPFASAEELRDLVDQARERGFVEEEEHEMIHSVFELGETFVRELMVPRIEVVWIESDRNVRQALSLALRSGFSRIPVIGESVDDIVGIVYLKDLAKRAQSDPQSGAQIPVSEAMRPATFVPESKAADELLREMQSQQIHMVVVIDEYGGTAGLITIEDILEEIVGEIEDEYDTDDSAVEWLGQDRARVFARVHLEDLASEFDIQFTDEQLADVDSVGGYMAKELGRVPIPGSHVEVGGLRFTAERPIGRRKRLGTVLVERLNSQGGEVNE